MPCPGAVVADGESGDLVTLEDRVLSYLDELSNWGRWGADDQAGTLNLIEEHATKRGLHAARLGRAIPLGRPISPTRGVGSPNGGMLHFMTSAGSDAPASGKGVAADWFGMPVHGFDFTHIDAPSHEFWNGTMYNGYPASEVRADRGALRCAVTAAPAIVTRGVLADMPRALNMEFLPPGYAISKTELVAALESQGSRVQPGDAVLVRTGSDLIPEGERTQGRIAGLHATCLEWIRESDIAVLGSDGTNDARPSEVPTMDSPVHIVGLVAMGLWLIDNLALEDLAAACSAFEQWEFLFTCCPLPLKNTTGSPVAPVATL